MHTSEMAPEDNQVAAAEPEEADEAQAPAEEADESEAPAEADDAEASSPAQEDSAADDDEAAAIPYAEDEAGAASFEPEDASVAQWDGKGKGYGWGGHHNRDGFRYYKKKNSRKGRRVTLRSKVRQGSKKDAGKAYGTTYYHKKTSYPKAAMDAAVGAEKPACVGSCAYYGPTTTSSVDKVPLQPEEDITYKRTQYQDHNKKNSHRNVDRLRKLRAHSRKHAKEEVEKGDRDNKWNYY